MQGNLDFVDSDSSEDAQVKDKGVLNCVAHLLQVDEEEARRALCSRVVAAKGEVMAKGHTLGQAREGRDALAKVGAQDDNFMCCGSGKAFS